MRATYSPEDNKLRLYTEERLSPEDYATVKAAGFIWAPKQKLFVAPKWTPAREDCLLELCDDIEDEDTTLAERTAERAERFEDYSDKRATEAERAESALGDAPSIVGNQSARKANKLAEKIQSQQKRTLRLWETSDYWTRRAAGALRAAKYKELPEVRARRIKGLESDLRAMQSRYTPVDNPPHEIEQSDGRYVWCGAKGRGGFWVNVDKLDSIRESCERWEEHYRNRIAYERAMLAESGGLAADNFHFELGGMVLVKGSWYTITRINRKGGEVVSVSVNSPGWPRVASVEIISDYKAPTAEAEATAKAATKLPPICNYPQADGVEMTKAQWNRIGKDYKRFNQIASNDGRAAHRVRVCTRTVAERLCAEIPPYDREKHGHLIPVYLTDEKLKFPPNGGRKVSVADLPSGRDIATLEKRAERAAMPREKSRAEQFREKIKGGVKAVSAPGLFPTPASLATQVIELAEIEPGHAILEPSAGTGALLAALPSGCRVVAVEINHGLADALTADEIHRADFLETKPGEFDRVVMNPPFANAADIKHVKHALAMLKPGGRLVAIVANGPRQQRELKPLATEWVDLPAGSFAESGTNVNTAIVVIDQENLAAVA
jgi:protein-L-isoaspartate O-methyltransferase